MKTDEKKKDPQEMEEFKYSLSPKKQPKGKGFAVGRIPASFTSTVARKKIPTLFDQELSPYNQVCGDISLQGLIASDKAHYIDRKGKEVALSDKQMRLIFALCYFLSLYDDDEKIREYEQELQKGYKSSNISIPISIRELTRLIMGGGKVSRRDVDITFKEVMELTGIIQAQPFIKKDEEITDTKVGFFAPLISYDGGVVAEKKSDGFYDIALYVRFGSIFFHSFYHSFAPLTPGLFEIWGKKGTGTNTELFRILLNDLLAKFPIHLANADKVEKKMKDERNSYQTEEDFTEAASKAITTALTYGEYGATLRERITTDYESDRRYKGKFKKDLASAVKALLQIGIITDYYESYPRGKEIMGMKMNFVFNRQHGKEEARMLNPGKARRRSKKEKV